MAYQKQWYPLALGLAKTHALDSAGVAEIHRRYGDHLYTRGDYDGSMEQYVRTIGELQSSYVIRKVGAVL